MATASMIPFSHREEQPPNCTPAYPVQFFHLSQTDSAGFVFGPFRLSDNLLGIVPCGFNWFRHIEATFEQCMEPMYNRIVRRAE